MSKIYLINKQGDRIAVENREWEATKQQVCRLYYGYGLVSFSWI